MNEKMVFVLNMNNKKKERFGKSTLFFKTEAETSTVIHKLNILRIATLKLFI